MKLKLTGLLGLLSVGVASYVGVLSIASGAPSSLSVSASNPSETPSTPAVKPAHILGMVGSKAAGASLQGVIVTLVRDGKPTQRALTNKDGKFVFAEVKPGPFQIVAEKRGVGIGHVGGLAKPDEVVKVAIELKKPS